MYETNGDARTEQYSMMPKHNMSSFMLKPFVPHIYSLDMRCEEHAMY